MVGTPLDASNPIFIGGLDRSGKTTMAALLTSHTRINIPAVGDNLWTYFYRRYGDLAHPPNLERCLRDLFRYKHVRFLAPDPARIRRELADGHPSYGRLFALLLQHHAERQGKARWGGQSGLIERYVEPILSVHPDARFIHLVRDPRDRYEASLAKWPEGRGRAGGAAARWRYSTSLGQRNRRRHPGHYLIVRFEDLVRQPEAVMRRVCDHVGEAFEPDMLHMGGAPKHRDLLAGRAGGGPGTILSTEHIGRYAGRLSPAELAFLQLHTGRPMRALGYVPDPVRLTTGARLRFALTTWPDQAARMAAWRTVEAAQERLPRAVPRRPGRRMIIDAPLRPPERSSVAVSP